MSDKSGIAWTDATWNPTTGCTKVSPGCKFCYAKHQAWPRLAAMKTGVYTGRKFEDVQVHPERLDQPLRWTKPRMIFVNSMSDLFHEDIPFWFIDNVFAVMGMAGHHIFQVLTKRPERMLEYMQRTELFHCINNAARDVTGRNDIALLPTQVHGMVPGVWPFPNVWLGVSVENQETADERIPLLLETPAAVRWISAEPLLEPIRLHLLLSVPTRFNTLRLDNSAGLHWVVVGGESGPKARPMQISWCTTLLWEVHGFNIPFFMKQGSQANWADFRNIDSFPLNLQVRQYPKVHQ